MIFLAFLCCFFSFVYCLTNSEAIDFMYEDECLTPGVINPSSKACKSRRNVGGITPYFRMDNGLFMAKHSYPRELLNGQACMISTFDFRQSGAVPSNVFLKNQIQSKNFPTSYSTL